MIDYYSHLAALAHFRQGLAQSTFIDASTTALRDQQLKDAANAEAAAKLGALVDHWMWHASSDGTELALLERAATLWREGLELHSTLGVYRTNLEQALIDPTNAAAVDAFNTAAAKIHPVLLQVKGKNAQIQALKSDVHTFAHIKPHPRQQNRKIPRWPWSDIFLARRTDAFVREVRRGSSDVSTSAFALGALSSYSANTCISAYLGQVVGGPRRAHRHRDRLARNTVGSWCRDNLPGVPKLSDLSAQLKSASPALPAAVGALVKASIAKCYDLNKAPPLPDMEIGFQRLCRHLELLDTFVLPATPAAPAETFIVKLYADPSTQHESAIPQQIGVTPAPGTGGSGGSSGIKPQGSTQPDALTNADAPDSTEVECGSFWEAVGLSLLFVLGGWFYCVIKWAGSERCPLTDDIGKNWDDAFPDGVYVGPEVESGQPQALTASDFSNAGQVDQVIEMIGHLFDTQCLIWEALNKAYDFLAVHGLIYPHGLLQMPRYKQFLTASPTSTSSWPRLVEPDPNRLHLYPLTGLEQSTHGNTPPTALGTPLSSLLSKARSENITSTGLGVFLWHDMALGTSERVNYDLDADRGYLHPCWATGGAIDDTPVPVSVLPYSAI